jgi:hypothetical protein
MQIDQNARDEGRSRRRRGPVPTMTVVGLTLGFLAVLRRPLNPYAWAALLLFLSLSQVPFRFGPTPGFQWIGSPMLWHDWSRIPGLCYHWFASYAWPAPLTMALAWLINSANVCFLLMADRII